MQANTDGQSAYTIKKMYQAVKETLADTRELYKKEIADVFAKRDEKGEYTMESFEVEETKKEEFKKAEEDFSEVLVKLERPFLTLHNIRDAKLSGSDIESLSIVLQEDQAVKTPHLKPVS